MLLFRLLILGHLIADFPLQSAGVYRLKKNYLAGQLPHALIYFVVMLVAGYPLLGDREYRLFALYLAASHLLMDLVKIRILDRRVGGNNLYMFLLDQAIHVAAIAAVFLTSLTGAPALRQSMLAGLDQRGLITTGIFFLIATFAGVYLLDSVWGTFFTPPPARGGFAKCYGIIERGILFACVAAGGAYLALLPVVVCARLPVANYCAKRFQAHPFLLSMRDLVGNLLCAALCALAVR